MDFTEENILLDVVVASQSELFKSVARYAEKLGFVKDVEKVYEAFVERESEYSTGLQDGFAIPHAKSPYVLAPTVLFIRLENELEWETFDESRVKKYFCFACPKRRWRDSSFRNAESISNCFNGRWIYQSGSKKYE